MILCTINNKDNTIREKGAKLLSEALKVNTTLKILHLNRERAMINS